MDMTTLPRLKERMEGLDGTTNTKDIVLQRLITALSKRAEKYLNRHIESTSRTEYFDVLTSQNVVTVRGVPISSITSIHNDTVWDFGSSTEVSSTYYTYQADTGEICFDMTQLSAGNRVLKVVYTGGMAASTTAFISSYPDLTDAIEMQIIAAFQDRRNYGLATMALQGTAVTYQPPGRWIPEVREVLDLYRFIP